MRLVKPYSLYVAGLVTLAAPLCGCTTLKEYVDNGFKVGPNYGRPPAPVAQNWIDAADPRVRSESDDLSKWWKVFNDPVLDDLVCSAYLQNLTLRQAGMRVLEARAQLGSCEQPEVISIALQRPLVWFSRTVHEFPHAAPALLDAIGRLA